MNAFRPVLLMTRPRPASERFLTQLNADFAEAYDLIAAPVIGIEWRRDVDLPAATDVVFSSRNAVEAAQALGVVPQGAAHCVGRATMSMAQSSGWTKGCLGETADDLVAHVTSEAPPGPLLHLRGAHSRGDIAQRLTAAGITTHEAVVYDQPEQRLNEEARAALASRTVVAPLFSPRSAAAFARQAGTPHALHVVALSGAVADALGDIPLRSLTICPAPDADNMRNAVAELARTRLRG